MYRVSGVLVLVFVLLGSPYSFAEEPPITGGGSEIASGQDAKPEEHVRHLRAHRKPSRTSEADETVEPPEPAAAAPTREADKVPVASVAQPKPKTKQQAAKPKSRIVTVKETMSRPATPAEILQSKPRGFFEELFNQE
jgi:hypothetical protein